MTVQVVCVHWGTKYSDRYANSIYRAVRAKCSEDVRFVCITEHAEHDLDPGILVRSFPDFGVPLDDVKRGCLAKLGMFFEGVLEPGLATVYIDLDTMVRGDIAMLANRVRAQRGIYLMPSHWVPTWRIAAVAKRVAPRFYYHGNSSILAFFPEDFHYLGELFKQKLRSGEAYYRKAMLVDDRFISCFAWERLRIFSARDVVKFAAEYGSPLPVVESIRKRLPWVTSRREHLIAVTFPGTDIKPEQIAGFQSGQRIRIKNRRLVWEFEEYSRYWREVCAGG